MEESEPDTVIRRLSFHDNDLEIFKRLDEDFRDHFAESGKLLHKRTQDEDKLKTFLSSRSLFIKVLLNFLYTQASETFEDEEELNMAKEIIGHIDDSGFLGTPLSEIALLNHISEEKLKEVLRQMQMFDPPGVAAEIFRSVCSIKCTVFI